MNSKQNPKIKNKEGRFKENRILMRAKAARIREK